MQTHCIISRNTTLPAPQHDAAPSDHNTTQALPKPCGRGVTAADAHQRCHRNMHRQATTTPRPQHQRTRTRCSFNEHKPVRIPKLASYALVHCSTVSRYYGTNNTVVQHYYADAIALLYSTTRDRTMPYSYTTAVNVQQGSETARQYAEVVLE